MSENTQKRRNYNTQVVKRLAEKYGLTERFIRLSLREERTSETAMTLKKEYKKLVKKVEETLKQ